jgi:hypothetical protein
MSLPIQRREFLDYLGLDTLGWQAASLASPHIGNSLR